jgi:hypothetical protein
MSPILVQPQVVFSTEANLVARAGRNWASVRFSTMDLASVAVEAAFVAEVFTDT